MNDSQKLCVLRLLYTTTLPGSEAPRRLLLTVSSWFVEKKDEFVLVRIGGGEAV